MPVYEYHCEKCGKVEELSEKPLKYCPKCGRNLKLKFSKANFKLIGRGFYKNDYKKFS